ncbi:MAG TPA: MIP/aquaporin family protein [Candidatus Acidoferrales bacterium]
MTSPVVGEFMGTAIMVLLGDGVVANVSLKKSYAEGGGWMVITTGWAFSVLCGIYVSIACGSSAAHLNPAVTLGFAVASGDYSKLAIFVPAQLLGAFVGAVLVWIFFYAHWKETPDPHAKLAIFATGPAIRNLPTNFTSEVIATCLLVFVIASIFSKAVSPSGLAAGLGPLLVACLVWAIGLCLGGTEGYPINPARDLGPRIAHAILPIPGKGGSNWGYAWLPVVAPLVGAAVAGVMIRAFGL